MTEQETIIFLGSAIMRAVMEAADKHPDPVMVLHATPRAMAGLAGSQVLQMLRSRIVGDGETDKLLSELCTIMRDHADPGKNGPGLGNDRDLRHMRRE